LPPSKKESYRKGLSPLFLNSADGGLPGFFYKSKSGLETFS